MNIDENKMREDARQMALDMIEAIEDSDNPATMTLIFNAVGNVMLGTLAASTLCVPHRIETFQSWASYMRGMIERGESPLS